MIKLYELVGADDKRRFSPYCWRVSMALAHKGLEVESIPWLYSKISNQFFGTSASFSVS